MCKSFVKFFLLRTASGNACDLERTFCGMVLVHLAWPCHTISEAILSNSAVLTSKGKDYLTNSRFIPAGLTEVYSWGNGANYQLGIGTAGIQRIPCRLDALQTLDVTHVAAAKFHSAAVTASGDVYTWGFGRGGRLGHPDFDIHRFALTSCDTLLASCF